jgi:adenylate cyclase
MEKVKHKTNPFTSLIIGLGAIILALIIGQIPTLLTLELDLLDYRFKLRGPLEITDSPVIIVTIDDQSDESTPEMYPWPRDYYAHVIENLNEAGAAVIGIDVIFEKQDIHGKESDNRLAEVLGKYDNIVLAGKIAKSEHIDMTTLVPPYEKFISHGTLWGLVSFVLDDDGFYRRYFIGQTFNDSLYSPFGLEVLKIYKGMDRNLSIKDSSDFFTMGSIRIPKYSGNSMLINFVGPRESFPYYSFDSIIDDEEFELVAQFDMNSFSDPGDEELSIPPGILYSGVLKDKIVLIGATMHELHDEFPTPFLEKKDPSGSSVKALTPGVEIHANAIQTILSENYLFPLSYLLQLLIFLVLAVMVYFINRFLPTLWTGFIIILLSILYFMFAFFLFVKMNTIIEISTPILLIFFSFIGHTLYHYIISQKEKRMIRGAFSHYVPEKVVNEIIANPEKLKLGGEERIITVLFSDIVGFTTISEKLTPPDLVKLLNEYLSEMTDIVLLNNGIIDKYEGDAIMAEFGVPVQYDNHAFMACKAALEMQNKLQDLRIKWKSEEKPPLTARIGINTGEMIVGNMGSRNVFDYTVMGDHVNIGSRLEGLNKYYGTYIIISEYTYNRVKDAFYTRELDLIRVKGKVKPLKVFELIELKEKKLAKNIVQMLEHYQKGLELYRSQQWNDAIDRFDHCLKLNPGDKSSEEFRKRCIEYKFNSPGPDWDGVVVMTEK